MEKMDSALSLEDSDDMKVVIRQMMYMLKNSSYYRRANKHKEVKGIVKIEGKFVINFRD